MDTVFASTGVTHQNTYEEFEKIVGKTNAEAALRRYFQELDAHEALRTLLRASSVREVL
jgi:hypothetical protein